MRWMLRQVPLREKPGGKYILDLPIYSRLRETGIEETVVYAQRLTEWIQVIFQTDTKDWIGWVYKPYTEEIINEFVEGIVSIPNPTPDLQDAAQYMIWRNKRQYNLCGELCVCFLTGDDIDTFLAKWEATEISFFQRVFSGGYSTGTGLADLDSMLDVSGYDTLSKRLAAALVDPVLGRAIVSPGRFKNLLNEHRLIVSVKIEKTLGRLRSSGYGHWVVIEQVIPDGIERGWVEIYNPFVNQLQRYSWSELLASMDATPQGLLVRR